MNDFSLIFRIFKNTLPSIKNIVFFLKKLNLNFRINTFRHAQTSRPVLSNQEIVIQMLNDLDKVDRNIFGTESLYSKSENDQDMDFDRECK